MQSLADVVALDLARDLDCRTIAQMGDIQPAADASRDRNPDTLGARPDIHPELGSINSQGDFVRLTDPDAVPGAVKVNATTSVNFVFGMLTSGAAGRVAIAQGNALCATPPPATCTGVCPTPTPTPTPTTPPATTPPCSGPCPSPTPSPTPRCAAGACQITACMKVGSSTLDGLVLSQAFNVASYNGLVGANVKLSDLAVALGVGTVDRLMTSTVSVGTLLNALVTAAANDSDPGNNGTASVLTSGVLGSITSRYNLDQVAISDLVSLGSGGVSGLDGRVSVLGLVTGAAYVANGSNAIAVPVGSAFSGTSVKAFVTEPPQMACGPGIAETGQVRLEITQSPITLLGAKITLNVVLGKARAGVSTVRCSSDTPNTIVSHVDELGVATTSGAVTLGPVNIALTPSTSSGAGATGLYDLPLPLAYTVPTKTGSGTLTPPVVASGQATIPGLTGTVINLAVGSLTSQLTGPSGLLTSLGLRVAGADLFAISAECSVPVLIY